MTEKSLNIQGDCVFERGRKGTKREKAELGYCSDLGECRVLNFITKHCCTNCKLFCYIAGVFPATARPFIG